MFKVIPIPAFKDNYIWLLVNPSNQRCAVVDPGDAEPVIAYLEQFQLSLEVILITHHHHDHTGGIKKLSELYPVKIYGPTQDPIEKVDQKLIENDQVKLDFLNATFTIYDIPGHTRGHIAYYGEGMLFCGDTLFAAGCGRLFEGTPEQMYHSLSKILRLPDETLIYCAHEYTQANLHFAETVEPENKFIQQRLQDIKQVRGKNLPSLPSVLSLEKLTNPFLRCHLDSVINSAQLKLDETLTNPVNVFRALRAWKDTF